MKGFIEELEEQLLEKDEQLKRLEKENQELREDLKLTQKAVAEALKDKKDTIVEDELSELDGL